MRALALLLMLWAPELFAQSRRCAEPPRPPLCLERLGSSSDNQAVAYCRSEVNAYRSRLNRYLDCLADVAEQSRRDLERAERKLDCHARGGSICP